MSPLMSTPIVPADRRSSHDRCDPVKRAREVDGAGSEAGKKARRIGARCAATRSGARERDQAKPEEPNFGN